VKELIAFPLSDQNAWDTLILKIDTYSFFHSMAWARVLSETYGFTPLYIAGHDKDDFFAVPLMIVRNPFLGKKGVCLPFSDSCGPLYTSKRVLAETIPSVLSLVKTRHWKTLEFRGDCGVPALMPHDRFYEHVVSLRSDPQKIIHSFRSNIRRDIQHADREGVQIKIDTSMEAVYTYYRLHCMTRKRHGVPPQPRVFFKSLHRHIIDAGNGFIARAVFRGNTIAAAVFLHLGSKAVYKFSASLPDQGHLQPSKLILWAAIQWYASHGFDSLSLGRTNPEDAGLMQFKNGWGAECHEILYYRWPPTVEMQLKPHPARSRLFFSVTRKLPVPILRVAGTLAYKYLG
jgi:hypothetical protein